MKAISLFDFTGTMLVPWRDAGYECWIVDIQHPPGVTERDGMKLVNLDLMGRTAPDLLYKLIGPVDFVAAFPPCDHLAVSGARWFKGKGLRALADSVHMFATAAEYAENSGAPYMIENPMSTISTYWREPDHKFHPCQFTLWEPTDNYTKETWLWTGNGFKFPARCMDLNLPYPDDRIHKAPPGPGRANFRSATPMGFARAVYEANKR